MPGEVNNTPVVLSIETATLGGSLCLRRGDELLACAEGDSKTSHSNTLLRDVDQLLHASGLKLQNVDLLALAQGPGSFTGLRIGIATAKALAVTLNLPCIAIPTLPAVAAAAGHSPATVAALPAGRGELFVQLLSVSDGLKVTELDAADHLPPTTCFDRYGNRTQLLWTGEGAEIHQEAIRSASETAEGKRTWQIAKPRRLLADAVAILAAQRFAEGDAPQVEAIRALYVRPADAKRSLYD